MQAHYNIPCTLMEGAQQATSDRSENAKKNAKELKSGYPLKF